jgi:hypothetical protein
MGGFYHYCNYSRFTIFRLPIKITVNHKMGVFWLLVGISFVSVSVTYFTPGLLDRLYPYTYVSYILIYVAGLVADNAGFNSPTAIIGSIIF